MSFLTSQWRPPLDWDTQAGRALTEVIEHLPRDREWLINVFGSAPLQMGLDRDFLSADVDIFTKDEWRAVVNDAIAAAGLTRAPAGAPIEFYVQCTPTLAFRTSDRWKDRACLAERDGVQLRFAHPIDILISKIHRLAKKDLKAFDLVIQRTGHPTDWELVAELRFSPHLLSSNYVTIFDTPTFYENTLKLWPLLFGRQIDLEQEVLEPVREMLREAYDVPDLKSELSGIVTPRTPPDAGA